jgi:hypothetical protein
VTNYLIFHFHEKMRPMQSVKLKMKNGDGGTEGGRTAREQRAGGSASPFQMAAQQHARVARPYRPFVPFVVFVVKSGFLRAIRVNSRKTSQNHQIFPNLPKATQPYPTLPNPPGGCLSLFKTF